MELVSVGCEPVKEVGNLGVDSGVSGTGTSDSPGNDSDEVSGAGFNHGATRVSLARVLTASIQTSADHGIGNIGFSIGGTAFGISDDGNGDGLQSLGKGSRFRGGSPSGDRSVSGGGVAGTGKGDGGGAGRSSQVQGAGQSHDGDIVLEGEVAVLRVNSHGLDVGLLESGFGGAQGVQTSTDGEVTGLSSDGAVSGGDDGVGVQDGTSTDVASAQPQGDLVRNVTQAGIDTSNDSGRPQFHGTGECLRLGYESHEDKGEEKFGHFEVFY